MPESESWNDIETILKQFKKLYPNVIPWSDNYKMDSTLGFAGPAFGSGAAGEWSSGNSLYYDKKSDKFVFTPTMSQYKDMLIYFNRLVNEGLLDKSSLTQSSDKAEEKFINGKSFMMAANSQEVVQLRTKMDGTIGKGKYEIKKINVFVVR
jgi:putative aldouronate transport system substrate-binding protein